MPVESFYKSHCQISFVEGQWGGVKQSTGANREHGHINLCVCVNLGECNVECVGEVMPNTWKIMFLAPVVSVAEWP